MITVQVYRNSEDDYKGFEISGHAGYAESGSDIICAAASALVINCINSISEYTKDSITVTQDEEDALIRCIFDETPSSESVLLVNSMLLGLNSTMETYGDQFIKVIR